MKFAVVTLGSAGDLHPFLAVARALAERGHEVHLLSQAPYEAAVRAEGVGFIAVAGEREHQRTLQHPLLWHPLHGFGVLWRHLAVPAIGPTLDALDALSRGAPGHPLVVFASPLAAGARLARERWPERIRLASGYTAPMGLRSTDDPLFVGPWRVPSWVPRAGRRALWRGLDRWKLEPLARPVLAGWCERLQLQPLRGSIFGEALHSPDGGLAMYPAWFAEVPGEWRARRVHQLGFPVFESSAPPPTPPGLAEFLANPAPYVVAYPGSADKRAAAFAERVIAAARALGHRTLVLSRFAGSAHAGAACELCVDEARLSDVLPRAGAFVHHGGIGSAAQAIAAGAPQLVLASAYDQFENGARLTQLGLARWLREGSAPTSRLQRSLSDVLGLPQEADEPEPTTERSRPASPNEAVIRAVTLLEHMQEQLSLPDLTPQDERFEVDKISKVGRSLEEFSLFFALVPTPEDAERIANEGHQIMGRHGLTGSPTTTNRLHASICEVSRFPPGADIPRAPVDAAVAAADRLVVRAFTLNFVQALSVKGGNAFVIQADSSSQTHFSDLRRMLVAALRKVDLRPSKAVPVHVSLAYGSRPWVETCPIEPILWRASRLVLILSHRGLTHHQWIKEWTLPDR
jgi:rhamnosyltransferase subunit B